MEKVRIGNDMRVNFSVYRNGEPESFDGASNVVTKLVNEAYNRLITHTYTIAGNIVQFDIDALQLTQCGKCRLFISYTKGGDYTVDSPAFELVNYTDQTGGTEIIGVEIVSINISGDIGINRDGLSAYEVWESYPGNEGKTIEQYFTWLRENPTKIDLDGLNSNIRQLKFNTATPVAPTQAGQLAWSDEEGTLALHNGLHTHPIGRETFFKAKNNSGALIANGKAVYAIGSTGANATIGLATTANGDIAQRTIGIATMDIASNGFGDITTFGEVNGINTSGLTEGALVYLGLNGNLTSVEPVAPTPKISLGLCIRSHLTQGRIAVYVRPIARLNKLTDVYAPNLLDGDVLRWNGTALRYEVYNLVNKADLVGGKVPASQLPSYVDDVLEYANLAAFPAVGETGKLYVTLDTNLTYRWSGSAYTEVSKSLAIGITSTTAFRGDWGKIAYDHSQAAGNPHGTTAAHIANTPAGTISATTVQAAINELDADRVQLETDLNTNSSLIQVLNDYNDISYDLTDMELGFYSATPPTGENLTTFKRKKITISDSTKALIITASCRSNAYNSITDINNNVLWSSNAILNKYNVILSELLGTAKYFYFSNETAVQANPKIVKLSKIVDSSLSINSVNPVQNKVVSEAISLISDDIKPMVKQVTTSVMTDLGYIYAANGLIMGETGPWVHSDMIKKEFFISAGVVTNASVASVACYSTNEISTVTYLGKATGVTSPTTFSQNLTYPVGTQYVVISSNAVSSPQNVTYLQESEFKALQVDVDFLKTNVSALNAQILKEPDVSPKMLHFSFDDTIASLRDLNDKVGIYTSIFDSPFFGALKTIHDKYGCVFSCYCFYDMIDIIYVSKISDIVSPKITSVYYLGAIDGSYAVGYYVYAGSTWVSFDYATMKATYIQFSLANMTNTFATEFKTNSSWLKFGLHSIDSVTNYASGTAVNAKSDYDNFIAQIIRITGTPDCIDLVVRLQNFSGNLITCQAMRDTYCGIIGLLTGDYSETSGGAGGNSTGYYLSGIAETTLWKKGHWIDYTERLHFYPSSLRIDAIQSANMAAYMAKYLTTNKWGMAGMIIMFAHENQMFKYSTRAINSDYIERFNNIAIWAKNNGFTFGFPMNRLRSSY